MKREKSIICFITILQMAIIFMTTTTVKFMEKDYTNNPAKEMSYQLQLVINNQTEDINGKNINLHPALFLAWFYLDIKINSINYNDDSFINNTKKENNNDFHYQNRDYNYNDIFWTTPNKQTSILTLNLDPRLNQVRLNFTFGIFANQAHYQNTCANNYLYDFHKTYFDTKNNGTKLIINANGDWTTNTANWGFQYYKF